MSIIDKNEKLRGLYRSMLLVRTVEETLIRLFADSEVPGFIHLSIGQEAVAAGVMAGLEVRDTIATTHRGHGHVIARGLNLDRFFSEVMGKAGGVCGGRGGSMHIADMRLGIIGANGIVGAGIPIALGSAWAHSVRKSGGIAVVFFGDGAMAEGVLHESLNLASLWNLPILFVCENNGWSEFSPTALQFAAKLKDLSNAFKISHVYVDACDVVAVALAADALIKDVRNGDGPRVLECSTQRVRGHYEGDPQKYRASEELAAAGQADPLKHAHQRLLAGGVGAQALTDVATEVQALVIEAVGRARQDVQPEFDAAFADVYSPRLPALHGAHA